MRLEGKVAIITGGSAGMGRSTAELFTREGASVIIGDLDVASGERAAARIQSAGGEAIFQHCDVSIEEDVFALVEAAETNFGKLDILFNNAGVEQSLTPSHEVEVSVFDHILDVNLKGTFLGCKHAIRSFLRHGGGVIVNNSSVSAYANVGGNVSYACSKGAIMSLTRVDLATDKDALRTRWMAATPMGRMGTGEEIAETVLYLASDQSSFTTGIGLLIDGGRVAT